MFWLRQVNLWNNNYLLKKIMKSGWNTQKNLFEGIEELSCEPELEESSFYLYMEQKIFLYWRAQSFKLFQKQPKARDREPTEKAKTKVTEEIIGDFGSLTVLWRGKLEIRSLV